MFDQNLLSIVRPLPVDTQGLVYVDGTTENGMVESGETRSPATGECYEIKNGYLDLLRTYIGADSIANLTNFLPGAGRGYEPLWRVRSLPASPSRTSRNCRLSKTWSGPPPTTACSIWVAPPASTPAASPETGTRAWSA